MIFTFEVLGSVVHVKPLHVSVALDLGLVAVDTPLHLDIGCKGVFHMVRIKVGMKYKKKYAPGR